MIIPLFTLPNFSIFTLYYPFTIIHYKKRKSENLLQQDFSAENPNEKWLTDITEIPCKDAKMQSYTWHRFWIAMTAPFGVSKWILTCEPNFAKRHLNKPTEVMVQVA
jgi:hypothetical protein